MLTYLKTSKNTEKSHKKDSKPLMSNSKKTLKKQRRKINRLNKKEIINKEIIESGKKTDCKNKIFTDEQFKIFKEIVAKRKKALNSLIKISLKDFGVKASLDTEDRNPLDFYDIQHLIIYVQHGNHCLGNLPEWIQIKKLDNIKRAVILVIEGIGFNRFSEEFNSYSSLSLFKTNVQFLSPLEYGGSVHEAMSAIPLSANQQNLLKHKYGSLEASCSEGGNGYLFMRKIFNITPSPEETLKMEIEPESDKLKKKEIKGRKKKHANLEPSVNHPSLYKNDNFPRTKLLLTPWEMINENYPLPIEGGQFNGFKSIKDEYKPVTDKSPMFGLDCEMCRTREGNELTRVSIVNEKHEIVYERLVKPYNRIINYMTEYSGITHEMLKNVWTRLEDVQDELNRILPPDAILVGQSLNSDLLALKLMHPYVIDTSCIFNLSGERHRKTKLKILCQEFLSERIQCGEEGHDSIEDSLGALKLVQAKLSNYLEWGNAVLEGKRKQEEETSARVLLEQRDQLPKEPFVRKYAENCICDDRENSEHHHAKKKKRFEKFTPSEVTDNFFGTNFFQNLISHNRNACLIGKSVTTQDYISHIPDSIPLGSDESRLRIISETSNKRVISKLCEEASDSEKRETFYVHVNVKEKCERPLMKLVNKWSSKIRSACADGTLFCLILAGESCDPKGLCAIDYISSMSNQIPMESIVQKVKDGTYEDLLV